MEGQAERPYSPRVRGSGSIWRQWVHREQSDLIRNINYGGSRWTIMEAVDKLDRHLGRSGMCLRVSCGLAGTLLLVSATCCGAGLCL